MMNITKFQAYFIKYLRITCGGSWRWVAAKWSLRYEEKKPFNMEMSCGGNQIDGMMLCESATRVLEEESNKNWNSI